MFGFHITEITLSPEVNTQLLFRPESLSNFFIAFFPSFMLPHYLRPNNQDWSIDSVPGHSLSERVIGNKQQAPFSAFSAVLTISCTNQINKEFIQLFPSSLNLLFLHFLLVFIATTLWPLFTKVLIKPNVGYLKRLHEFKRNMTHWMWKKSCLSFFPVWELFHWLCFWRWEVKRSCFFPSD